MFLLDLHGTRLRSHVTSLALIFRGDVERASAEVVGMTSRRFRRFEVLATDQMTGVYIRTG